jgi:hypothetical protein
MDTTIAGLDSISYVSVIDADNYFKYHQLKDKWQSIGDKETFLVMATRQIDNEVFLFDKYDDNQSLEFPRTNHLKDNVPFIHRKVKDACCEQALFIYLNKDNWIEHTAYTNGSKSVRTGADTIVLGNKPSFLCPMAERLLEDFKVGTVGFF